MILFQSLVSTNPETPFKGGTCEKKNICIILLDFYFSAQFYFFRLFQNEKPCRQ